MAAWNWEAELDHAIEQQLAGSDEVTTRVLEDTRAEATQHGPTGAVKASSPGRCKCGAERPCPTIRRMHAVYVAGEMPPRHYQAEQCPAEECDGTVNFDENVSDWSNTHLRTSISHIDKSVACPYDRWLMDPATGRVLGFYDRA